MGGGGDVIVPGPTAEETALTVEQTNLLREQGSILQEQVRVQNLLSPFLFESAGVEPIFADVSGQTASINTQIASLQEQLNALPATVPQTTGTSSFLAATALIGERTSIQNQITDLTTQLGGLDANRIVGFNPIVDPNEALRGEIETGFLERTQAALKGELPVNPALLKDLGQQEEDLNARLFRNLGPGFETSTPGIESLSEFATFRENILESARRGDLTLSEQLGITRERSNEARIDDTIARILGINQATLPGAAGLGGVAAGFGAAQIPFQQQRQLQTQASLANAQQSNFFGDIFGTALGQASGFGFGRLFGAFPVAA